MKHMWSEEEIQELIDEQGGSSGSEVHLYMHFINGNQNENFTLYTSDNTPFTTSTVKQYISENINTVSLVGSYYPDNVQYFWYSLSVVGDSLYTTIIGFYNNNGVWTKYIQHNFNLLSDKVSQIF